eukprot:1344517-Pyramimonas_sp.AAC.1
MRGANSATSSTSLNGASRTGATPLRNRVSRLRAARRDQAPVASHLRARRAVRRPPLLPAARL